MPSAPASDELKPCPFCFDGGEPKVTHDTSSDYKEHWAYRVWCRECGAETDYRKSRESAINMWNQRARLSRAEAPAADFSVPSLGALLYSAAPAAGVALEAVADLIERLKADDLLYNRGPDYEPLRIKPSAVRLEAASALVSSAAEIAELRAKLSLALDTVDMNYHHCKQAEERAESAAAERDKACKEVDMLLSAAAARGEEPDLMLREFENLNEQIDAAAAKERSLRDTGRFLLDRLDEYDPGAGAREFCGHVEPAIDRFRATLDTAGER